jgi:hypothetical protein
MCADCLEAMPQDEFAKLGALHIGPTLVKVPTKCSCCGGHKMCAFVRPREIAETQTP